MQPCLSPPSVSLHEMRVMICGGKQRICLTDSSKHNGSIYQEQPEIRVRGGDGREARSVTKRLLVSVKKGGGGSGRKGGLQERKRLLEVLSANVGSLKILPPKCY